MALVSDVGCCKSLYDASGYYISDTIHFYRLDWLQLGSIEYSNIAEMIEARPAAIDT